MAARAQAAKPAAQDQSVKAHFFVEVERLYHNQPPIEHNNYFLADYDIRIISVMGSCSIFHVPPTQANYSRAEYIKGFPYSIQVDFPSDLAKEINDYVSTLKIGKPQMPAAYLFAAKVARLIPEHTSKLSQSKLPGRVDDARLYLD